MTGFYMVRTSVVKVLKLIFFHLCFHDFTLGFFPWNYGCLFTKVFDTCGKQNCAKLMLLLRTLTPTLIAWIFTHIRIYFNSKHPNISFSLESESNKKMFFLDVQILRGNGRFRLTVQRKPTFSSVYTHFDSFPPTTYKFSMIYILARSSRS